MTTDELIDALTDGEGDTVTFGCKNPDFNGLPNECVTVNASWTGWQDRDFRADTRQACLEAALAASRESPARDWDHRTVSTPLDYFKPVR